MVADAGIYGLIKQPQVEGPLESYGKGLTLQNLMAQAQMGQLQMGQMRRSQAEDDAVRQAYAQSGGDPATLSRLLMQSSPKAYQSFQETQRKGRLDEATIGEKNATAGYRNTQSGAEKIKISRDMLAQVTDEQSYQQFRAQAANLLGPENVNKFPPTFQGMEWRDKSIQTADSVLKQNAPNFQIAPSGALINANPNTPGNMAVLGGNYAAPSPVAKLLSEQQAAPADQQPIYANAISKATTHQPATTTNVSVSTEKAYGGAFGKEVADKDSALRDAALKAPEIIQRAVRVRQVLSDPAITGAGADFRLALGKSLKLAGIGGSDNAIENTEVLAAELGANTLSMIKQSGLGSGNGFTDKDLAFLRQVTGGSITLEKGTMLRIADLNERAARASAGLWERRKSTIPPEVLKGTGIGDEKIDLPAPASSQGWGPVQRLR